MRQLADPPHNDYFRRFASRHQVRRAAFATRWHTVLARRSWAGRPGGTVEFS